MTSRQPSRRRLLAALVATVTFGAGVSATPAQATPAGSAEGRTDPVSHWLAFTLSEISHRRTNPPRAARALALISVALDRAGSRGVPAGHGAAGEVLAYLYPDLADEIRSEAGERGGTGRSFAAGQSVGRDIVSRARSDGSEVPWSGTRPVGPAYWEPAPPGLAAPLEPAAGTWATWNLRTGSEFRPGPPPAPGTDGGFETERTEVYEVSRQLTEEQRAIALFWADGAGTETPAGHWNRIAMTLVRDSHLSWRHAARVFALLNTAQADAFIAAWDTKYAYWSVRPITAIRAAIDPEWSPFIATPPFPSYVSGHATTSGAASTVLAEIFPESAPALRDMAELAALSRLYGGIHFSSDNVAGLSLGRRVGQATLERYPSSPG